MREPNERECMIVDMWYEQFPDTTGTGWAKLALAHRVAEYREEIEAPLRAENERLREAVTEVIDGNDLAFERGESIVNWKDSWARRIAIAALAAPKDTP